MTVSLFSVQLLNTER